MSSDSTPSTPAPLTPESTGSLDPESSDPSWKKQRRQVAFYPNLSSTNKPLKPFSRSAAKRESVMTLGSIEHLQHYFTKTGLAADKKAMSRSTKGLVPALGGLSEISTSNVARLPRFELPPSPAIPQAAKPSFPPTFRETDPKNLRPAMIDDLESVARIWDLDDQNTRQDPELLGVSPKGKGRAPENFDVLSALKTTTRAIRSVRNYVLSLPSESTGTSRAQYRPQTLPSAPIPKRHASTPSTTSISLGKIRKAALNVLAVLRELEEKSRLPLSDEAYDAQSDHGGSQGSPRVASPFSLLDEPDYDHSVAGDSEAPSFTLVRVRGRYETVPVWEELEDDFNQSPEEEKEKREGWEERLVLGSGWLYKQGIQLDSLVNEREEIKTYLSVVDDALFDGPQEGKRGWEKERERKPRGRRVSAGDMERRSSDSPDPSRFARRVASTGALDTIISEEPDEMDMITEEDSVEDDDLPIWAKRSTFQGDPLGRAHATLVALLPSYLLPILPLDSSDRMLFLQKLSSGQALCVAYNTGVRQSRKPWGYISKDAIHDIVALEVSATAANSDDKGKPKGWTFRRTDNLRLWIAALKLRYLLPITGPVSDNSRFGSPKHGNTPMPSPVKARFNYIDVAPVVFDAPLVARFGDGWAEALETVLLRWVDAVVGEQRGEMIISS